MEITIKSKTFSWLIKLFFCLFLVAILINIGVHTTFNGGINILLIFLGLLIFIIILFFVCAFLLLPFKIIINEEMNTIKLQYFFGKIISLKLDDVESYSLTHFIGGSYSKGVLLFLSSDKCLLISDFNFKSYLPMLFYLNREQVNRNEMIDLKWIKYFKNCIH